LLLAGYDPHSPAREPVGWPPVRAGGHRSRAHRGAAWRRG